MDARKPRWRQLPPSAVPVSTADLWAGLATGPEAHEAFRAALADYFGLPPAGVRLAASGRTALYTLLRGLHGQRPSRSQVVMPAYTCPSVPKVVLDLDLQPVYVDIEPRSMRYISDELATAVGEQTLAVCLIHPFGIPQPIDDVLSLAHDRGALVIEDAAQALGSRWQGQPVGLAGDFGLFSLGPGKPLSTGGGGILITRDAAHQAALAAWWADLPAASTLVSLQAGLRQIAFQAAFHPRSWWAATRFGLQRLGNHEASWGYALRDLSAAQAAVGRSLLPRLDELNAARRCVAERLAGELDHAPGLQNISISAGAEPIYLRLPVLAESLATREALFQKLWSLGVGVGRMYERPLPAIFPQNTRRFPGAEAFAQRLLTLPTHYHVTDNDLHLVAGVLHGD